MKTTLTILTAFLFLNINMSFAAKTELKEYQIVRNVEENVYKTVRLMIFHSQNANTIGHEDMKNLISAFGADQSISKTERAVLNHLEGGSATFAIESPFNKSLLVINKTISSEAESELAFFWNRLNMNGDEKDMVANYLYFHLPGRFFEYYYFNSEKEEELISNLTDYLDFVCRTSEKENWTQLRDELNRINAQINIGNKAKEENFRKILMACYKETREKYDSPKVNLAMAN